MPGLIMFVFAEAGVVVLVRNEKRREKIKWKESCWCVYDGRERGKGLLCVQTK